MRGNAPIVVFYIVITVGFVWSVVELISGEAFDALVLFSVTIFLKAYRGAVIEKLS